MDRLKKLFLMLFLIAMVFATGCEKFSGNDEIVSNQVENRVQKMKPIVVEIDGHMYYSDIFGRLIHFGYYMRSYQTKGYDVHCAGEGCYRPEGNCLPDAVVYGCMGINHENDNSIEITEEMAAEVKEIYSDKLIYAVRNGRNEIKKFFLNNFASKTDLPELLIQDFKADKLTIKNFHNNYFIVNESAVDYKDVFNYFNE